MNYIWEVMLQADKEGIERESLTLINASSPSPYLEVSFEEFNRNYLDERVIEVNPLYRFSRELGRLVDFNVEGMENFRALFFDLFFHYTAQLDLREGLSKQDYYLRFLHRSIQKDEFGEQLEKDYALFTQKERKHLCRNLLRLMKTEHYLPCFKTVIRAIYPQSLVYENNEIAYELLLYLGVKETEEEVRRIHLIIELYLPIQETVHIFYDHHFGIIGVDETMRIGEMAIF